MALKKLILIFAIMLTVLILAGTGYASASPLAEEWNRTYEMSDITSVESFQQTADSGYIIAGNTRSNAFVLKTGPTGSEQWNRTFDRTFSEYRFKSVLQTSDGGYLIAGETGSHYGDNPIGILLVKADANGYEEWNRTFTGIDYYTPNSLAQTLDGGYIIAGIKETWEDDAYYRDISDLWLIKTDSKGNIQWYNGLGGSGKDSANFIQQTSDGGYIFAGSSSSYSNGNTEFWLVKLESDQIEPDEVSTQSGTIPEKPIPGFGLWAAVVSVVIVLFQKRRTISGRLDFK